MVRAVLRSCVLVVLLLTFALTHSAVSAQTDTPPDAEETEAPRSEPPPVAEPAPPASDPAEEPANDDDDDDHEFRFGSYGRVSVATDLDGHTGSDADLVRYDPRIDEGIYAELELRRHDRFGSFNSQIVATIAIAGPLFHFDGDFEEYFAVRNLYAQVDHDSGAMIWAGSRMVRGDDIYLLDHWPLDNLNLVGGGASYSLRDLARFDFAFGWARPNDPFQLQQIDALSPSGFVPEQVTILDRPRLVVAAKAMAFPFGRDENGFKVALYGEGHFLPSGERELEGGGLEALPSDRGYVLGGQIGGWLGDYHAFANLFIRYAHGLAAYDPLGVPFSEGAVIETDRARELVIGLSANFEWSVLGLQLGGYYRRFRDADPGVFERNQLAEGAIVARPHVWFGQHVGLALEASYQALELTALEGTAGEDTRGTAFKFGVIPFVSPLGRGTYTRPHIRLIYALTRRDAGARRMYPERDRRSQQTLEHFFGVGAEWWFDSSSYQ